MKKTIGVDDWTLENGRSPSGGAVVDLVSTMRTAAADEEITACGSAVLT